jgi:hypothetical protein
VGAEPEGVTLAGRVGFAGHVFEPWGAVEVIVDFGFVDCAEDVLFQDFADGEEVAILEKKLVGASFGDGRGEAYVSPVLETCENQTFFFCEGDD